MQSPLGFSINSFFIVCKGGAFVLVIAGYRCGVAQKGAAWLSQGAAWLRGCGVAQKGEAWLRRVRRGSEGCGVDQIVARRIAVRTAGPSSNLGSAPQRRPSTERKAMRTTRVVYIKYCMSAQLM
jgi:hypothetical protein